MFNSNTIRLNYKLVQRVHPTHLTHIILKGVICKMHN